MAVVELRGGAPACGTLVCVHPVVGSSSCYQTLVANLRWPGPVLGVDAPGLVDSEDVSTATFADRAIAYVEELGVMDAPVLLLGWALGGVMAAEMSLALDDRGVSVGFLGVLDGRVPQPEMRNRPTDRDTVARFFFMSALRTRQIELGEMPSSSAAEDVLHALRRAGAAGDIADVADMERRIQVYMSLVRSFSHHEQRALKVALDLFESADEVVGHPKPPTLGWDDLVPALRKHTINGTHFSLMADRYSAALAAAIDPCLEKASSSK